MKAIFDNQERDFHINREDIPFLEHSLGRGLYAVLKDAVNGEWTFQDVAAVISYALHGPAKDDRSVISLARTAARMGFAMRFSRTYRPHPDVVAMLERDGHGNYAELMADVLSEAVFGETAEVPADAAA
jgi:hypothetical protein